MHSVSPENRVMLQFVSLEAISQFKNECACCDFYIDREALTLVGSFTAEQVAIATGKYHARPLAVMK